MLTGEPVGRRDRRVPPTKIHEQQRTGARPLDPCAIKSHIPPAIGAAVASALAFDPAERWPTVRRSRWPSRTPGHRDWGETGMETCGAWRAS
jgi:hypothetical protein